MNPLITDRLSVDPRTIGGHIPTILSELGLEPVAEDHRRVLAVLAVLAFLRG